MTMTVGMPNGIIPLAAGQKLLTLEAMKMETTLYADRAAKINEVLVKPGSRVDGGDLLIRYRK